MASATPDLRLPFQPQDISAAAGTYQIILLGVVFRYRALNISDALYSLSSDVVISSSVCLSVCHTVSITQRQCTSEFSRIFN